MTEDEESKPWAEIDPPKKYRLVRADNMEPLGDWTTNLQAGMEYLERRPDWLPKYVYVDEDGKVVPDKVGVWDVQCGLVKLSWTGYAEYLKTGTWEEEEFEKASEGVDEQVDPTLCKVCGSNCTDFNLDYSAYWCHQCQRECDEDGDPINQDNGEEE